MPVENNRIAWKSRAVPGQFPAIQFRTTGLFQRTLQPFGALFQLLLECLYLLGQIDKFLSCHMCRLGSFKSCFVSGAINPTNRRPNFHRGISKSIFRHVIALQTDQRWQIPCAVSKVNFR